MTSENIYLRREAENANLWMKDIKFNQSLVLTHKMAMYSTMDGLKIKYAA